MAYKSKYMRISVFYFMLCLSLLSSCKTDWNKEKPKQQSAIVFDALNQLQIKMDGHLYSTFPKLEHPCFPSDTSFTISSAELLAAINSVVELSSIDLSPEEWDEFTKLAVEVQESYRVEQCYEKRIEEVDGSYLSVPKKVHFSGTWVLPEVLGSRDVVLKWF